MEHTPGPWNYQATAGNHDYVIYGEDGKDLALVRDFHEANARLIAALPDYHSNALYLDSIMPDVSGLADDEPVVIVVTAKAIRDIRTPLCNSD